MDAELPACRGHQPQEQPRRHHQFCAVRTGPALARFRRREDRGRRSRGPHLCRGHAFRDAGRRGAQAHGQGPDDLLRRTPDVHCRRLRRTGFGRERYHDRRLYRECLFQSRVGAQDGQAFRPEYRLLVPVRTRRRSQHAGLRRQACRPADEGAGRRYDLERHYGHLPRSDRRFRLRRLVGARQCADRQGDSRKRRPYDHRGAGGEDPLRKGRRADGRRSALPGGRAA